MSRRLRTYLSGGMEYARNEGADWRSELDQWITSELRHYVFNPNKESEKYLKRRIGKAKFRKLKFKDIDRYQHIVKGIVHVDSTEIARRSDYVICYWDRGAHRGAGTKGELTIAQFFGKPVFMVTRMNRSNIPGWVLGCTTHIFRSFGELKKFLWKRYGRV